MGGKEQVVGNYCIWISGRVNYDNDIFRNRYNWTHSSDGTKTNIGKVFKTGACHELAII